MTPSILLALLISAGSHVATGTTQPNPGTAPVPPVRAVPGSLDCRGILTITGPAGTELEFGGDIGDQPPLGLSGRAPAVVGLGAGPGATVRWVVQDYRSDAVFAEGTYTVPPCISVGGPDVGTPQVGHAIRVERRRTGLWADVLRRWGAW